MGAKLNQSLSIAGVRVHQDHEDPTKFHYYPSNPHCKLGETLTEFKVIYWGIGPQYFVKRDGQYYESVGAILAGKATVDMTEAQRSAITQDIREKYGVEPKLSPLILTEVTVKPVFAGVTLGINNGDIIFPEELQFGSSFQFLVGSPDNVVFANFVANKSGSGEIADPTFGINVDAKAEFVGDPWKVKATADLKQVWSYVRKRFGGGGINIGWIRIKKAEYERVMVDMEREQVLKTKFETGSMDNEEFGRQVFELGKDLFSSLNINSEFFKFEPLPDPADPEESLYGWGVSLNAGYVDIDIDQSIHWEREIEYTGRVKISVPSALTLAVDCNNETKQHFEDLANSEETCITTRKMKEMMDRYAKEKEKIEVLKAKLWERLIEGDIEPVKFQEIYDIITGKVQRPTHEPAPIPESNNNNNGELNLVSIDPLSYID